MNLFTKTSIFSIFCIFLLQFSFAYTIPYSIEEENARDYFQTHAYCTIPPETQTIFSILEDIHYESTYNLSDTEALRKQCRTPLKVKTFLKNNA